MPLDRLQRLHKQRHQLQRAPHPTGLAVTMLTVRDGKPEKHTTACYPEVKGLNELATENHGQTREPTDFRKCPKAPDSVRTQSGQIYKRNQIVLLSISSSSPGAQTPRAGRRSTVRRHVHAADPFLPKLSTPFHPLIAHRLARSRSAGSGKAWRWRQRGLANAVSGCCSRLARALQARAPQCSDLRCLVQR